MNRFRPGWQMTLFVLVMLPILVSLGSWQLRRGAEKEALETGYLARSGALPLDSAEVAAVDRQAMAFVRLRLAGQYLPDQYYLIDNQVRDGAVGYWVLHPFVTGDGRLWLVNRGFVPAPKLRNELPAVTTPGGQLQITALIWPDTGLQPRFGEIPEAGPWPRVRQRIDARALAAEHTQGQPLELRLESAQPGVLAAAPSSFASGAARHRGYAVQWFGLAAVLMTGFVLFGLRRRTAGTTDAAQDQTSAG